jgi:hypothetical protein
VTRKTSAITCMASGVASLTAAGYLTAGVPASLAVLGVSLIALAVLLGWT